jgi:hypothetical protein
MFNEIIHFSKMLQECPSSTSLARKYGFVTHSLGSSLNLRIKVAGFDGQTRHVSMQGS